MRLAKPHPVTLSTHAMRFEQQLPLCPSMGLLQPLLAGAAPEASCTEQLLLLRASSWLNPAAELGFEHGKAARAQRGLIDVEILLLEENP